ncbi:MAG: porin family protein [Spirochaetia bacterium]|nr:porin family protein [Spirochaetia bacterium]
MKKTLIAVAAAAALTTSAFAEITFGAWLRALAAPVASNGEDTVASMGNSWGYGARTARINIHAAAEDGKVGFEMGVYNDVDGIADGDDTFIWGKPIDMLTVSFGKFDGPRNGLRGDVCYGSWNWLRPTSSWIAEDEGLLMSGLYKNKGVKLDVTPIDGLLITAFIPITTTATKVDTVYKKVQAGFAYNIDGIGKIKAQYIGKGTGKVEENGVTKEEANSNCDIEAAFDLTAVENLYVGVGFKYANIKDGDKIAQKEQKMKIALGATYQVSDELKLSASGAYFMYQEEKDKGGVDPRFQAGVGVDYNLGDGLAASADVRYLSKSNDLDNTDHIAFSVGVTKGISSNGYMGVAFQGQTNSGTWANTVIPADTSKKADKFTWCVPVAISCWF